MYFRLEGSEVLVRLYSHDGQWVGVRVVDAASPPRAIVLEKVRYLLDGPRYIEHPAGQEGSNCLGAGGAREVSSGRQTTMPGVRTDVEQSS